MSKPMRGTKIDDYERVSFPCAASPKLDGIRAIIKNGVVLSKTLKPLPNYHLQSILGHERYNGLDGELILGDPADNPYKRTHSAVMSYQGEPDLKLHTFDEWNKEDVPFIQRHKSVIDRVDLYDVYDGDTPLTVLPHNRIESAEMLAIYEDTVLGMGYEGVMLRDINGPYKHGKATLREGWLLKLKRFTDSEAEILGMVELQHNDNESTKSEDGSSVRSTHKENLRYGCALGALVCKDIYSGVEFNVGTGFNAEEREVIWREKDSLRGKIIKYKSFPYGVDKKPRHPVFLGWRDKTDISGEES